VKYDCVVLLQKMAGNKEQNFHVSGWGKIATETFFQRGNCEQKSSILLVTKLQKWSDS